MFSQTTGISLTQGERNEFHNGKKKGTTKQGTMSKKGYRYIHVVDLRSFRYKMVNKREVLEINIKSKQVDVR